MKGTANQLIRQMPKLELHIHLEGTFDIDTICRLAEAHHIPLPRPREELFSFPELQSFLEFLDWICSLVRDENDAQQLAYRHAKRVHEQGLIYTEVIINPSHWKNIPLEPLVSGVLTGFERAYADGYSDCRLLISLRREQDTESARATVEWILAHRHPRLIGLSVDGNEALVKGSNQRFAPLVVPIAEAGLGITAHAGESSGPEGVWEALKLLKAQRIDHGVRAVEEPALLDYLQEKQIPLNVCYTSNLVSGIYTQENHPLGLLYEKGIPVTVSTDDPQLLNVSLCQELETVAERYHWTVKDLLKLQYNAVDAAFCTEEKRMELRARLDAFAKEL